MLESHSISEYSYNNMSLPSELEKSTIFAKSDPITPDSSSADEGYVLDAHKLGASSTLKTTCDGSIIL